MSKKIGTLIFSVIETVTTVAGLVLWLKDPRIDTLAHWFTPNKIQAYVESDDVSEEDAERIVDFRHDMFHEIGYDWCAGRPLEFQVGDDGLIEFWEPSSC